MSTQTLPNLRPNTYPPKAPKLCHSCCSPKSVWIDQTLAHADAQAFLNVRTQHSKWQPRPPCLCCHRHYQRLSRHWRPNTAASPALSLHKFTACQDPTLSLSVWCPSAAQLLSCAAKQAQVRPNDAAVSCIRRTAGCAGAHPGACCPAAAPYR